MIKETLGNLLIASPLLKKSIGVDMVGGKTVTWSDAISKVDNAIESMNRVLFLRALALGGKAEKVNNTWIYTIPEVHQANFDTFQAELLASEVNVNCSPVPLPSFGLSQGELDSLSKLTVESNQASGSVPDFGGASVGSNQNMGSSSNWIEVNFNSIDSDDSDSAATGCFTNKAFVNSVYSKVQFVFSIRFLNGYTGVYEIKITKNNIDAASTGGGRYYSGDFNLSLTYNAKLRANDTIRFFARHLTGVSTTISNTGSNLSIVAYR